MTVLHQSVSSTAMGQHGKSTFHTWKHNPLALIYKYSISGTVTVIPVLMSTSTACNSQHYIHIHHS